MTILWAGTEPEAFEGRPSVTTSSAQFDSDFSRCALVLGNTSSSAGNDTFPAITMAGLTEVHFHALMGNSGSGSTDTRTIFEFRDNSAQGILRVRQDSSYTSYKLQYWSGATWTDIGSAFTLNPATIPHIDLTCKIDGSSGEFSCKVNGTTVASLTGNTDFFSASIYRFKIGTWGAFLDAYISECILSTTSTLGMRLATLAITGAGTTTNWTTGTYADVDDTTENDTDFISSDTANQVDTFALGNLSSAAAALVPIAVIMSARAKNAPTGPQNLDLAIRSGGTDYFGTPPSPTINTGFQNGFQYIWAQDPATAADWTPTNINALEGGAKSIT